jgi:hypothetical protein
LTLNQIVKPVTAQSNPRHKDSGKGRKALIGIKGTIARKRKRILRLVLEADLGTQGGGKGGAEGAGTAI